MVSDGEKHDEYENEEDNNDESITANVSGDWHILVEPEITIGNETKVEAPLLLSISVQSWLVWQFWLMLAAIIVAVPTGALAVLWKFLRRKCVCAPRYPTHNKRLQTNGA